MSKAHRFEALDAWRGICALAVALEHLNTTSVIRHNAFVRHSYRFVDFFFVLSGFVIAHAYGRRMQGETGEARSFLIRRVGRLWPLHATILFAWIVLECGIWVAAQRGISINHRPFTEGNTLAAIAPNLLLVHGWGIFDHLTWNGPSWSISTEAFAYLLFAGVCVAIPSRRLAWTCALLLVAGVLVTALAAPDGMESTFDFGIARCVYGFMAGVLVRTLWGRYAPKLGTLGELAIVIAVAAGVMWLPLDWRGIFVTPLFALAVWVFASEDGALSRALRRPWPQALGAWSYSIYMVHAVFALALLTGALLATKHGLHLFGRVDGIAAITGSAPVTAAITAAYLGAVILVASFTYRRIELPGQRWAARWATRRPRLAVATTDGSIDT
jgi:peptidoglycan/LPS O-acetylase OafA/YrhL